MRISARSIADSRSTLPGRGDDPGAARPADDDPPPLVLPALPTGVIPETAEAPLPAVTSVGSRIRDIRRSRGWTQDDLAHAVGVSRSAVAQWETDRAGQVRDNLSRIADTLGVSSEFLLAGRDPTAGSGDELALLRLYRELAPEDRQLLLRTARRLAKG